MIYFGKPCKHCARTERLATNGQCRNCHRLKMERRNRAAGQIARGRRRDKFIPLMDWVFTQIVASPETGCYLWTGPVNRTRRPIMSVGGKYKLVSRFVLGIHECGEDVVACHTCDNGMCIRPEHLFAGTQKDNIRDCMAKGRFSQPPIMRRGAHPNTKIRQEDIPTIIARRDSGESTERIGLSIGCSGSIVRRAIRSVANTTP